MKKRVRVYKCGGNVKHMGNGGSNSIITQDSKLDPIPQQKANNFSNWLQESAQKGAIREQQKQWEEYMKLMNKGGVPAAIPGYQDGGPGNSPGATYDDMTKNDTHLAYWQRDAYNKNQDSTNEMMGYLGGFHNMATGVMGQPDVYKMKPGTINPFGEGVDMTGMEITGIEPGKNKRHRTMTYKATGVQGDPTDPNSSSYSPFNNSDLTDEQFENQVNSMYGDSRKNPKLNDAWLKTRQGISNFTDTTGDAFSNAWYKMQQGRADQSYFNGGQLRRAQDGTEPMTDECPVGYQKDYKGDCVNTITGEIYFGAKTDLKSPGLENPFAQKQPNPLTGAQPMGFNASGQAYVNEGLNTGSIGETPDLMSGMNQQLETQGTIDLKKQSKLKTFDERNPYVKGEAIPAALNALAWLGEGDERAQAEADLRRRMSDPFMFNKTLGPDRGDYMANVPGFGNELKPDDHVKWGMDTKVAQDGGEMSIGDEQELSDEEIERLIAQGYKLEFID